MEAKEGLQGDIGSGSSLLLCSGKACEAPRVMSCCDGEASTISRQLSCPIIACWCSRSGCVEFDGTRMSSFPGGEADFAGDFERLEDEGCCALLLLELVDLVKRVATLLRAYVVLILLLQDRVAVS